MFRNAMPRYEVLSEEAMATLDKGWRRLMTEIGVEFMDDRALELFREAGQRVEDNTVFLDPDFVLEQVAKAPREFDVQARNHDNDIHIGGDSMAFGAVYGPPFVREGDVRRDATMDDFRNFTKLAQSFAVLDSAGGVICEPNDTPLDSRHLDMTYALQTLTDKIYMGNVVSGVNAADTIAMSSILFGSREAIEETPATISLINCNSPLRWDDRMLEAQFEYSGAGQPVVLTPFILMGAMSPVTIPAALVQQIVEALSGIALSQLIRPGTPVIFGSFLSNIDMQSGSPTFGTPESGLGLLCTGQIARHFGLPFRTGGGLTSSQVADAQAGYEALMTMMPTFLAGANWVMHSAGWLEGGLVAGYEKFIVDIELLQMLQRTSSPRSRSTRPRWRSTPTRRSATVATSSARCTRWSASAPASTGRCCRRRRTTSAGCATAGTTPTTAPRSRTRRRSRTTSSPRSTTRSARSSRTTSSAAAPSSATDRTRWSRRSPSDRHETRVA